MRGKVFFFATTVLTAGGVYYVHKLQVDERERMYDGVLRDLERQRLKKKVD